MNTDTDRSWAETSTEEWGQEAMKTTSYVIEDNEIVFTGTCPACGHFFTDRSPLTVVHHRVAAPAAVTVKCRCTEVPPHANRPDDVTCGCGAYWNSEVP